eukprot:3906309-Pyramimonas_sp.AAC.2
MVTPAPRVAEPAAVTPQNPESQVGAGAWTSLVDGADKADGGKSSKGKDKNKGARGKGKDKAGGRGKGKAKAKAKAKGGRQRQQPDT